MTTFDSFSWPANLANISWALLDAPAVPVETWHAQDVSLNPQLLSYELSPVIVSTTMPQTQEDAVLKFSPNMPWAEEHFLERVSGQPLNPPPSHVRWPFARKSNDAHLIQTEGVAEEKFSHTYPERFWPKEARAQEGLDCGGDPGGCEWTGHGIRYPYGDLDDVVNLLAKQPLTRQAYLPVFFPEDTGAVHGERIPCTLGYQFLIRKDKFNVIYHIRSCDFMRHFVDDVYMAVRLAQWVRDQVAAKLGWWPEMGTLTMTIGSLHIFEGDKPILRARLG